MSVLSEFWNNTNRSSRTGLVVAVALVLLGMAAALWWLLTPQYQLLFGKLREADAAEITKSLGEWKVPYRYTDDGHGIEVPADQVYDTRMKLVSAGVPKGGHAGFELFDNSDFGVTEFAQRVNYQRAIQGELERTIAAIPGVESVRVHLTIRRPGLFLGQDDSSKASIVVGTAPGEALTAAQVRGIRDLTASAVEGLAPSAVVVVGPNGVMAGGGNAEQGSLLSQNEEQSGYEARVRERISDLLGQVFKLDSFRVSVDARLNFDQVHRSSEHLVEQGQDGNGLLLRRHTTHSGGAAAAPGEDAGKASAQTQEDIDYAHGTEREDIVRAPGQVERLSIAVLVPTSVDATEIERLRKLITAAAGLDSARGDRLEIDSLRDGASAASEHNPVLATDTGSDQVETPVAVAPRSLPGGLLPWIMAIGVVGLLLGWGLARLLRPAPATLRPEEREAVLAKLRTWLAEGSTQA